MRVLTDFFKGYDKAAVTSKGYDLEDQVFYINFHCAFNKKRYLHRSMLPKIKFISIDKNLYKSHI